ncbi:hypothetical protein [Phaeodactylibacter luteus]|uniref:DUF4369 domain-containing protein n=1 Tax=Phaeodactylibacter luteus TaxID=1564516 RepID=A0A5C6RZT0_9BACT|nr:hypothetical protein [Phaeodactylibacter luteus]TXB67617.1 hypothetical protein FRY97_04280 [Phaeodactylibacter luteus]
MRTICTLLLLALLPLWAHAMPWRGYIVSKNGTQLTGYIANINHQLKTSTVVFINDFGDVYQIEAERIKGFVFSTKGQFFAFESRQVQRKWRYLRIVAKNQPLDLYVLTEGTGNDFGALQARPEQMAPIAYWVKPQGRRATKIGPWRFRKKMRRVLQKHAPELAGKIGKRGYRFPDVPAIIEEYNKLLAQKNARI